MDMTQSRSAAPLLEKVEQKFRSHLNLVAALTRDFAAATDYEDMAAAGLEQVTNYVGAEASSLFLLDETGKELICVACYGPVNITSLRVPADSGIVGRSVQQQKGQMVRDVSLDADFGGAVDAQTGFKTKSILAAPLSIGDEHLGSIEIINKNTDDGLFHDSDLTLLETLSSAAALALHNLRLTQQVVQQERASREVELAAEIQRNLLPVQKGQKFPIHGVNIPARSVSGDFYDILPMSDGRIWFNIGDVSGKGMNAALLMAKTTSLFRCLAKSATHPGQLLHIINNELCETNSHGMFVTMIGGLLDPATGHVAMSNAGHEPPLLLDLKSHEFKEMPAEAPPLGITPNIAGSGGFPNTEFDMCGGSLYIFTDGLTEARTFGGSIVGNDGARSLILEHLEQPAEKQLRNITAAVRLPSKPLHDDLTLLIVQDCSKGFHKPPITVTRDPMQQIQKILHLRLPARADRLKLIRAAVKEAAEYCLCDSDWTRDLTLAVDEASQNVIRHAYDSSKEPGDICIDFIKEGEQMVVHIMDFADRVDPEKVKGRDLEDIRPGGLGVHLINSVTDDARFVTPPTGVGNLFKLTKRL